MFKLKKKSDYFIVLCVAVLFTIIVIIIVTITTPSPATKVPSASPTPNAQPPEIGNNVHVIKHDDQADEKQLERLKNRQALADQDTLAKQKIISLMNPNDPKRIIYQTNTFIVDYVPLLDIIQVEILTKNIDEVKNDAVSWFKSNNMSIQGICALPLDFYVSSAVSDQLKDTSYVFSPLAPGCE